MKHAVAVDSERRPTSPQSGVARFVTWIVWASSTRRCWFPMVGRCELGRPMSARRSRVHVHIANAEIVEALTSASSVEPLDSIEKWTDACLPFTKPHDSGREGARPTFLEARTRNCACTISVFSKNLISGSADQRHSTWRK